MVQNNIVRFPEMKVAINDFEVEFEIEMLDMKQALKKGPIDLKLKEINEKIKEVQKSIEANDERLTELNKNINRLTNHSDGLDYMVAVGSGIIAALIDSFWVGDFSLERGKEWSSGKVNQFVIKVAKSQGYEGEDLEGAIRKLENLYGIPSDSNTSQFGGGLQHHLRDFAHHPTLVGLIFSMLTQFTGNAYGTDENGHFKIVEIRNKQFIGADLPRKILYGVVYWFFHMVSDMAGSSSTPGAGTGLPGPLLSLAKELATLPFFKNIKIGDNSLSVWISKLFNGTLLAQLDENGRIVEPVRFDLRAEIGVAYEVGRQAIPVIVNECLVRGFYFIRRFFKELKEKQICSIGDLKQVEWQNVLPFKNRTIVRMLTIATGTFTALDLGDATIRSAIKSKGNTANFTKEFLLKVNFVGVGRFAIAIGADVSMGVKQQKLRNERIALLSEQLHYLNANIFYTQAATWIAAEQAGKTINEVMDKMETTTLYFIDNIERNKESLRNIGEYSEEIEEKNPGLIDDMLDAIRWGKPYAKRSTC